jgi:hypothetical protein
VALADGITIPYKHHVGFVQRRVELLPTFDAGWGPIGALD